MNQVVDTANTVKTEKELLLQRIGVELTHLVETGDSKLDKILEHLRIVLRERAASDGPGLTKVSEMLFQHLNSCPVQSGAVASHCQKHCRD